MAMTLKLFDGSATIDLVYHSSSNPGYQVAEDWAPAVAPLRRSELGGLGPYEEVIEDIPIRVFGSTAADAYAKVDAINLLLDQADRWWRKSMSVSPVLLKYSPHGASVSSSGSPLQAAVLGRAPDDSGSLLTLPARFNRTLGAFVIDGIRLRFMRSGLWLGANETASAGAVANPAVLSVTMPSSPTTMGPLQLDLTGFTTAVTTGQIDIPPGLVILGPNLNLQEAESPFSSTLAASASYTSTADATARASGGNVGRLDHHLSALGAESALNFIPSLSGTPTLVAVFVTYRNNTNSAWTIRASGGYGLLTAAPVTQAFAPTIVIPGAATNPTVLYLGTLANRYGIQFVSLNVALTALVGAGTIDFDTIVFVDLSTGEASVISVNGARAALGSVVASQNTSVTIQNDPTSLITPDVRLRLAGGNRIPQSYAGPAAISGKGGTLKAIWYATHLYNGTTPYWTTQNVGGSAILNIGATISRKLAYVTPQ